MARTCTWGVRRVLVSALALTTSAIAADVLETIGFNNCDNNSDISVQKVNIKYDNSAMKVTFDVAGTSNKQQNVTAQLNVTAYGQQVFTKSFNPCDKDTLVAQLCPVPVGTFSATGSQDIPEEFVKQIPAIAFQVPDIAAQATLQLKQLDNGQDVACIQSQVSNGKTANVPAVSYIAAGIAGAALLVTGASAAGAAFAGTSSAGGMGTPSPSFTEVFGVFQGFAMNGMMSVNLPEVYRSFSKNFAFSTGLIPWTQMQINIDNFRAATGGNLTRDSVQFLQNATLVFPDGTTAKPDNSVLGRALHEWTALAVREISTSVNASSTTGENATSTDSSIRTAVSGIAGYAEKLAVPQANTFMTVLLIVAIVIAVIVVGLLLVKVILEVWALFASFPKALTGFRKHYWGSIARTVTSLILLLYGIWVLYCIFQFTHGDSWAAKTLAGVTLAIFTAILAFFTWKIWSTARKLRNAEGDISGLYDDKDTWVKYSLFYDSYRKDYWWIFIPTILYLFAKGTILAVADGHGLAQTIAQLIVEALMLILLLWSRPYERKSGNVINIMIAVVRVLSVACILVFVTEFGIAQTTQTVAGVVLIAIQSALTGILAILIAWNAIAACCRENPHRKRRKEMEKMQRDMDALTPLDARNSLLMDRKASDSNSTFAIPATEDNKGYTRNTSPDRYLATDEPANPYSSRGNLGARPLTPSNAGEGAHLVTNAAPISSAGAPTLPSVTGYGGYNNGYAGGYQQQNTGYAPYRGY